VIQQSAGALLNSWDSFYIIVGSAAAGLTGLMFVVIALVHDARLVRQKSDIATFGTPTVVHFAVVLFVSAVLRAPWRTLASPSLILGMAGFAALGYEAITTIRTFRSTGYQPEFEDWMFHVVLPLVAYVAMLSAAVVLPRDTEGAMFTLAGAMVVLLFVGIHNAWDTVTYIALRDAEG
jgi:hypothetical protein